MVYINNEPIGHISGLDKKHQVILSLIPDGTDWLRWAMRDKQIPPIQVQSETQLLEVVLEGLHSNQYIRFNSFRLVLDKLISMPLDDLNELAKYPNPGEPRTDMFNHILTANQIHTYTDLAVANSFVAEMNNKANSIFNYPEFSDMLLLAAFVPHWNKSTPELQPAAINFALANAATIAEFIDLCIFYLITVEKQFPPGADLSPEIQDKEVAHYYEKLIGILNPLLFAPAIGPGNTMEEMRKQIKAIAGSGKLFGYSTIASGARNLAQNINFSEEDTLREQTNQYLNSVSSFIASASVPEGILSQDGSLTRFRIVSNAINVSIGIDDEGNLVILPETFIKTNKPNQDNA